MTLPLALLMIGLGLLVAAALMWRARRSAALAARALDAVRLVKASEASRGNLCAVWGRALVESEVPDPITGRAMAWWDLRVARTTPEGSKTVHAASSGSSFLVADDSGAVRVPADSVDLQLSDVFVDYDGVPGPHVQRYLDTLALEAEAYAVTARHRFVPLDTELLVVGRFAYEGGQGNGFGGGDAPTVVGGDGLSPLVTTTGLDALKHRKDEDARHQAALAGRVAVIGAAFLLMAAAAALT